MSAKHLPQHYHSKLWRGILEFGMVEPADRIMVGFSGGKDSAFLLYALTVLQSYSTIPFEIAAITIDLGFDESMGFENMQAYVEELGVQYHLVHTRIADSLAKVPEDSPCAWCSYFRRAAMNRVATENGYNKVALAHHQDDAMETFLMNILYAGKISTFAPKTYLDRTGITVIRPMVYLSEKEVAKGCRLTGFVPLESGCPYERNTARSRTKQLIKDLYSKNRMVRANLLAAMRSADSVELWPAPIRRNRERK